MLKSDKPTTPCLRYRLCISIVDDESGDVVDYLVARRFKFRLNKSDVDENGNVVDHLVAQRIESSTLREAVDEARRVTRQTGCCYFYRLIPDVDDDNGKTVDANETSESDSSVPHP